MSHKKQYLRAGLIWGVNLLAPRRRTFSVDGVELPYFTHRYNVTWLNERSVEIPWMRSILSSHAGAKVLEVGNVLRHYDSALRHDVVDKYEQAAAPNIHREDALGFKGNAPYDLIVSVSTFEHVGWDESPRDRTKIRRTLEHLRTLLAPGGCIEFTAPVGYSPGLDEVLDDDAYLAKRRCLQRVSAVNEWEEVEWATLRGCSFHKPYPFANGLVFGRIPSSR